MNRLLKLTECSIQPDENGIWTLEVQGTTYISVMHIIAIRKVVAYTDSQGEKVYCSQVYTPVYNFLVSQQVEDIQALSEKQP